MLFKGAFRRIANKTAEQSVPQQKNQRFAGAHKGNGYLSAPMAAVSARTVSSSGRDGVRVSLTCSGRNGTWMNPTCV